MNKSLITIFLSALLLLPSLSSAEVSDIDPLSTSTCANLTVSLRYGDQSKDVTILQDYLNSNGYLKVTPTGFFGRATFDAVKAFQAANDISTSGFVGPITRAKIQVLDCASVASSSTASPSSPVAMCDYTVAPVGCRYIQGPNYVAKTGCGMKLSCGTVSVTNTSTGITGTTVTQTSPSCPTGSSWNGSVCLGKVSETTTSPSPVVTVTPPVCKTPQFKTNIKPFVCSPVGDVQSVEQLRPSTASAIKFTTGTGGIMRFSTVETATSGWTRYAVISECPGDFDTTRVAQCEGALNMDVVVNGSATNLGRSCVLKPNTTYYYNITHARRYEIGHEPTIYGGGGIMTNDPSGKLANICNAETCSFWLSMGYFKGDGTNTGYKSPTADEMKKAVTEYNALCNYSPASYGVCGIPTTSYTGFGPY